VGPHRGSGRRRCRVFEAAHARERRGSRWRTTAMPRRPTRRCT
jgi:hypothetical protein